ncbi:MULTISPECIES: hypothetical protein [Micromonospora]|uniref:Uncharacterized protein n=1 Tax=Micromonospora chalcea TaxID=1874 RepID=A0ABX9Y4A8_MICCH|nr:MULTISPECIES: hypothetical protein [Micromonospora]MBP1784535.1 hypothetical protein [Micromonospora sp. HB375]MDH6471637.1 hypothetical protein [Micromonospora sp. H404/HB375]ODB77980.1 hypothetical protein A8711_06170 [Micromonospora sp. II]RQW93140.1 hypothetical protein DLJ60_12370 [Micromonospora chalcea]RQX58853.1 hypothetical protein DLJ57_03365 [Micromonospora chalcea]
MTSAPANLLAVRNLLLTYLNVDKKAVRADDLEPAEVGIVGDPNHRGGYHCGSDRVVTNDYSVVESTRDRSGLTLYASALDVGTFSVRSGGGTHNLRTFSTWMVAQCVANAADTRDIREIIYSPDGRTVRRWDRLGRRTSGDSSHLYHTHFSFFRDSTKAGRDLTPLFRRYLTAIGMIATAKPEDDMEQTDRLIKDTGSKNRTVGDVLADLQNLRNWLISPANTAGLVNPPMPNSPLQQMLAMLRAWPALVAQVNELSGRDFTDEQQIVSGVLAGLPPEKIAEAIPPQIARDVADELSRRLIA